MEETHTFVPVYSPPLEMFVQMFVQMFFVCFTNPISKLPSKRTYAYLVLIHLPHPENPTLSHPIPHKPIPKRDIYH